jgi:hypothetical protein
MMNEMNMSMNGEVVVQVEQVVVEENDLDTRI